MIKDLKGQKFGYLTVLYRVENTGKSRAIVWHCKCDCGNECDVRSSSLISGHTKSCGCLRPKVITKHGDYGSRLYWVWRGMKSRCKNPKHKEYKHYGGRGITFCKDWNDYSKFKEWAIASGYDKNARQYDCTIDRIDVDGNYEPNNCRWVDMKIQQNNKRNSRHRM